MEVVVTSWWRVASESLKELVEEEYPAVGHACEFETSLMLYFRPELVHMELSVDDGIPPEAPQLRSDLFTRTASASLSYPFDKLTRNGVFGRPSLASARKGEEIVERVVVALMELVKSCWPDLAAEF